MSPILSPPWQHSRTARLLRVAAQVAAALVSVQTPVRRHVQRDVR